MEKSWTLDVSFEDSNRPDYVPRLILLNEQRCNNLAGLVLSSALFLDTSRAILNFARNLEIEQSMSFLKPGILGPR